MCSWKSQEIKTDLGQGKESKEAMETGEEEAELGWRGEYRQSGQ
jgi:hypothetical protein